MGRLIEAADGGSQQVRQNQGAYLGTTSSLAIK
jgi:hypothetical protein